MKGVKQSASHLRVRSGFTNQQSACFHFFFSVCTILISFCFNSDRLKLNFLSFPSLRPQTIPGKICQEALDFFRTTHKGLLPKLIAGILDQFHKGHQ
jgi:hypothetical protein